MGAYLAKPNTEKSSEDGSYSTVKYGSSAMQGWRINMEDSHISSELLPGSSTGLFAVFDGHGGKEASSFCARHFQTQLRERLEANNGDFVKALPEAFHQMDTMLRDPANDAEIATMSHSAERERAGAAGMPEGAPQARSVGEKAASMVKASVNSQLDEARRKGKLSQKDAYDIMVKLMAANRMEQKAGVPKGSAKEHEEAGAGAAGGEAGSEPCMAGCTANVVVLTPTHIYVANAGDSRAVLCSGGTAVPLSTDHKPNDERERARIEAAGGYVAAAANGQFRVNGNLNLSRAIGDLKYKGDTSIPPAAQVITAQPDVTVRGRDAADEFIVVGCDGIWDCMSNQEVCTFVRQRLSKGAVVSKICEEIFDRCISHDPKQTQGIGGDNMTCTIVMCKP